jgi:hypothetical protein
VSALVSHPLAVWLHVSTLPTLNTSRPSTTLPMLREHLELGCRGCRGSHSFYEPYHVRFPPPNNRPGTFLSYRPPSGHCAFTDKAGIHVKATPSNPSTYEILKPVELGLTHYVSIGYVPTVVDPLAHLLATVYQPSQLPFDRLECHQVLC